ncbi:MAG: hypothetical protein U0527_15385, partial [Candidatus Eisenbacteria bacterium]
MKLRILSTLAILLATAALAAMTSDAAAVTCSLDMNHAPWPGIAAVCDYNGGLNVGPVVVSGSCEITNYKFERKC